MASQRMRMGRVVQEPITTRQGGSVLDGAVGVDREQEGQAGNGEKEGQDGGKGVVAQAVGAVGDEEHEGAVEAQGPVRREYKWTVAIKDLLDIHGDTGQVKEPLDGLLVNHDSLLHELLVLRRAQIARYLDVPVPQFRLPRIIDRGVWYSILVDLGVGASMRSAGREVDQLYRRLGHLDYAVGRRLVGQRSETW